MAIEKIRFVFNLLTITALAMMLQTANATIWPTVSATELIKSSCPSGLEQYQELSQLKQAIVAAKSLSDARKMALAPTDEAIEALNNARNLVPFSDDLNSAETRLSDARSRILVASSQAEVADEFSGMMLAGLDNDSAARVSGGGGSCNYSTGEVIAIVVGLILGIIPGLILLVVLC
ncbi:MAG: hypothetical protein IPN42_17965 [Methylococcaceae bacterium]|nr:hypothetical protein [Methylococcaceae bacterium]